MKYSELKTSVLTHLESILELKVKELTSAIASSKESRDNDTKSSAGDKYETGREMMQIEINKTEIQLAKNQLMLHEVEKIRAEKVSNTISFGSMVVTNNGIYLFGLALGKIMVEGSDVFVISFASPLGKLFLNKSVKDNVNFNGKNYLIKELC